MCAFCYARSTYFLQLLGWYQNLIHVNFMYEASATITSICFESISFISLYIRCYSCTGLLLDMLGMICDRNIRTSSGCSLVQNHHDRIVAGNGAHYGGTFAVVDVISHAAGIAGRVRMTAMFLEKWSEMNPLVISISLALWSLLRLYMMLLGRTYTYFPFMLAALATFNCFKSRDKVACVSSKPSFPKPATALPENWCLCLR